MSRTFLIIDGDNLLHAAGFARSRYGPGQLSLQRRRLLTELNQRLESQVLSDGIMVFDGSPPVSDGIPADRPQGMHVIYSGAERDADSVIEQLLGTHSSPRQVIVVSGDHRLHKAASRRRAGCVDSDQFWEQTGLLKSVRSPDSGGIPASEEDSPPEVKLTREEVAEFLNLDVSKIRSDLNRESR